MFSRQTQLPGPPESASNHKRHTTLVTTAAALVVACTLGTAVLGSSASASASASPASAAARSSTASSVTGVKPTIATVTDSGAAARQGPASNLASFWTPARMRAATSLDRLTVSRSDVARSARIQAVPRVSIAAVQPRTAAKANLAALPTSQSVGVPWPSNASAFARQTEGRVFFTTHTGEKHSCSATVVNTPARDLVWTAGHCVFGTAGGKLPGELWHSNWTFVPGYHNGIAPFGQWTHIHFYIPMPYRTSEDLAYDVAAVTIARNSAGQNIVDRVGAEGFTWGGSPSQSIVDLGYPADSPYNGKTLDFCAGVSSADGTQFVSLPCTMTGGSSGGGWLINYNGDWGQVWAVNSFKYDAYTMYSSYPGSQVSDLYNYVKTI